jgi:hypothetical protein
VVIKCDPNFIRNFLRDLTLKRQLIAEIAIVLPRPDMGLVFHLNQLGRNSHFVRIAPDATLEHILHSQFTSNLVERRLTALVMHDRGARDYAHMLRIEIPQSRDHFFGHPVAEVFLRGVSSHILERKNCQHHSSSGRLGPSGSEPVKICDDGSDQDNGDPKHDRPTSKERLTDQRFDDWGRPWRDRLQSRGSPAGWTDVARPRRSQGNGRL